MRCYSVNFNTGSAGSISTYPRRIRQKGRNFMKEEGVLGLATIRKNRGISLNQIAESTKISVRSLEAIERGDFRKLPGGIYNTSYIRQYRPCDRLRREHSSLVLPSGNAHSGFGRFCHPRK